MLNLYVLNKNCFSVEHFIDRNNKISPGDCREVRGGGPCVCVNRLPKFV